MKFVDPREMSESMCCKPMTQRNLKRKAPSVRALGLIIQIMDLFIEANDMM